MAVVLYTADVNPFTADQLSEMRELTGHCSGLAGGSLALEVKEEDHELKYDMTMARRGARRATPLGDLGAVGAPRGDEAEAARL